MKLGVSKWLALKQPSGTNFSKPLLVVHAFYEHAAHSTQKQNARPIAHPLNHCTAARIIKFRQIQMWDNVPDGVDSVTLKVGDGR